MLCSLGLCYADLLLGEARQTQRDVLEASRRDETVALRGAGRKSQVASRKSQVASRKSQVASRKSQVASRKEPEARSRSRSGRQEQERETSCLAPLHFAPS
ncbi:hypothetical protein BCV69DRAFT_253929 [Microstroma glucosiphilum]|uniref:Uncharacterized protein n=1 Tax=Pseudomicrostroma glucosiphilum TaxID=1684307 RepID=A0A316TWK0_9BASI|nr:hypothetical protein BCV69DRAFT_253929 [Pseudomicrostroma glucosiphilum]PWN17707.1 hypothetical protein BCV69DRAFT_253929 [Pseudomicrostroma glucosiphilum]